LVHDAKENACQDVLTQYKPYGEVHHLAGTPHLADGLPTRITDSTVACPGRTSLSLFGPLRKWAPKLPNMKNTIQTFTFAVSLSISRMA
jgi:hypothetical protein